jgi:trehalose 2-sulfotransferase
MAKVTRQMATGILHRSGPTGDGQASGPRLVWAICTIARSGSSWLSQLVGSTQLLGNPEEYLLHWPKCCGSFGLSACTPLEEYLSCLMRRRSTPNGVFAIKGSFAELQPFLGLFPGAPCVWLWRENKLQQAVSWHRAHDGGLWVRTSTVRQRPPLDFSVNRALWFYDEILRREALWQEFFATRDVKPLALTYETVCHDPLAAVRAIAAYVGVDPRGIEQVSSPLRIVRDELTGRWVQRLEQAVGERNGQIAGAVSKGLPLVRCRNEWKNQA